MKRNFQLCVQPQKEIFSFSCSNIIFSSEAGGVWGHEKGIQGSMIIKLTKDKKIVNDMFKQEMFV